MIPSWTKFYKVDEAIECLRISRATQDALLKLMPDAYQACVHERNREPGAEPYHETPLEPDHPCRREKALSGIWNALPQEARDDLKAAYKHEWPEDTDDKEA